MANLSFRLFIRICVILSAIPTVLTISSSEEKDAEERETPDSGPSEYPDALRDDSTLRMLGRSIDTLKQTHAQLRELVTEMEYDVITMRESQKGMAERVDTLCAEYSTQESGEKARITGVEVSIRKIRDAVASIQDRISDLKSLPKTAESSLEEIKEGYRRFRTFMEQACRITKEKAVSSESRDSEERITSREAVVRDGKKSSGEKQRDAVIDDMLLLIPNITSFLPSPLPIEPLPINITTD